MWESGRSGDLLLTYAVWYPTTDIRSWGEWRLHSMNEVEQNRPVRTDKTVLIVDDDKAFLQRLARAMESRGFVVETADSVAEGIRKAEAAPPAFAVVDLRLDD